MWFYIVLLVYQRVCSTRQIHVEPSLRRPLAETAVCDGGNATRNAPRRAA